MEEKAERKSFVFASLERPEITYKWDKASDRPDSAFAGSTSVNYVSQYGFEYESLGDGKTQHGPTYLVAANRFSDFWVSMVIHLKDNPEDAVIISKQHSMINPVSNATLDFYSQIKNKKSKKNGDKQRYYSKVLQKVGSQDRLQYDRRYERVPESADGSFHSIYGFVTAEYGFYSFTDRYLIVLSIKKWIEENSGGKRYVPTSDIEDVLPGFLSYDPDNDCRYAIETIINWINSKYFSDLAVRRAEGLANNLKIRKEYLEKQAAEAAEKAKAEKAKAEKAKAEKAAEGLEIPKKIKKGNK